MVGHKSLVRAVSGLVIAGAAALAMGTTAPAGAEAMTATRHPGVHVGDPALCYRINYKLLCIAQGDPADPAVENDPQEAAGPPVRQAVPDP